MDPRIAKSLRKAAELLKAGDAKKARPILVEILRRDSEIEQAWYMLSFAVPIQERRIYALQQTLRINPNNEKAKSRLAKILGGPGGPGEADTPRQTEEIKQPEPQKDLGRSADSGDVDLLSQRLFGGVGDGESDREEAGVKDFAPSSPRAAPREPEVKKAAPVADPKKRRKGILGGVFSRVSRRTLVLLVLTAIIGGGAVVFFPDQFGIPSAGVTGIQDATETPTVELTTTPEATETPTPTATQTATLTPAPTITETTLISIPTSTPDGEQVTPTYDASRPTSIPIPTVDLNLPEPAEDVQEEMGRIKRAMAELRGLEDQEGDQTFLVSDIKILNVLQAFARPSGYRVLISNQELSYRLLGLIGSNDTLDGYPQNLWADPEGVLYVPDNFGLLISGFSFSAREKYLFVQGIGQDFINDQFDINSLGIYPLCEQEIQTCDAIRALIKGDATMQANQWLQIAASKEEQYILNQVNYFVLPVSSPALFLEHDLAFPYVSGASFVQALYDSGGWEAVDAAYENLPNTTEQILHPEKYLDGEEAIPVEHPPLGNILERKWRELFNESFGEWKLFLLLAYGADFSAVIEESLAEKAVSGWGGDQVQIYYNDFQGDFILAGHWVWDTSTEASEFVTIFGDYLESRNEGLAVVEYQDAKCWQRFGEISCFHNEGIDVYWFIAPDMETMGAIFSLYELAE